MSLSSKNYYEILGIERNASKEAIKKAYHEIARVYHPDSNFYSEIIDESLSPEQEEFFRLITEAYNTLMNEKSRAEYDALLPKELPSWESSSSSRDEKQTTEDNKKNSSRNSATYVRMSQVFGKVDKPSMFDQYRVKEVRSVADMMKRRRIGPRKMLLIISIGIPMLMMAVITFLLFFLN